MTTNSEGHIRVVLVNTHQLVLSGLQRLIDEARPHVSVVGTASTCSGALEVASAARPHVVLIEDTLAAENDAAIVSGFVDEGIRVLLFGGNRAHEGFDAAIARGASGIVHADDTPETLLKAIRKVHDGEVWLDRTAIGRVFNRLSRAQRAAALNPVQMRLATLTSREREVIRALVRRPACSNKELAASLCMGEHTLRNHLSRIYDKLHVENRRHLYVFALQHGLAAPVTPIPPGDLRPAREIASGIHCH